jgi:diacylglycerol kinase
LFISTVAKKLRSMQGGQMGESEDATSLNDTASYALDAFLCVFKCIQVFRGHCFALFMCVCAVVRLLLSKQPHP